MADNNEQFSDSRASRRSPHFNGIVGRLAQALLLAPDLDALLTLYVSNELADTAPELQRSMRQLFQTERKRRETENTLEEIGLPPFSEWSPVAWLRAGPVIIGCAETAAMTGDPGTADFGFALLQWWFLQISQQVTEAITCVQD